METGINPVESVKEMSEMTSKCPNCGNGGFVAKPYPEQSKCLHCGAEFYGCDQEVGREILEG
jgi:uncharacterized protein (DUF983 family)